MRFVLLSLSLCLLPMLSAAQQPQSVRLKGSLPVSVPEQGKGLACADQFAGTFTFGNFTGQSNDVSPDTLFLCRNDSIRVLPDGNADLSGDPDPGTLPGITYGFFDCPPTTTGPDLATLLTDPCILNSPPPANGIWVAAGGSAGGNLTFLNDGSIQGFFNGGNPTLVWFAPLTIDDFADKQYEADPVSGTVGPCVHLNTDTAFAVVYLNEIKINNFEITAGLSGCEGAFSVAGGLPQFDGSSYDITISMFSDPSVVAEIISGPAGHGSEVVFQIPQPGLYQISVEDGKSCGASLLATMSSCVSITQSIPDVLAAPDDNICVDVVSLAGWTDIVSIQYALAWDEAVIQYDTVVNLNPLIPGFSFNGSFNSLGDSLIFSWFSPSGTGLSLADGTVLFQVCFDVVGTDGDCSDLSFVAAPLIEVVNESGDVLGFNGTAGSVCVANGAMVVNISALDESCPDYEDGSFTVMVDGGQAPYTISWEETATGTVGGPVLINLAGGSFTADNLPAGSYSVTVTDAQDTAQVNNLFVQVGSPPVPEIIFLPVSPLCNAGSGSIATSILLSGTPIANPETTFLFDWSNGSNESALSQVPAGVYTLSIVENMTGCVTTEEVTLSEPEPLTAAVLADTAACQGLDDGQLTVQAAGGTPDAQGAYSYSWGMPVFNDTAVASSLPNLAPGTYPVTVSDANGCTLALDAVLPAQTVLGVNAVVTDALCAGVCNGQLFVTAVSLAGTGTAPYTFDWAGAPVAPPPATTTATTAQLANLCTGTYTLAVTDAQGCSADTTFVIGAPPSLLVSVEAVQPESCQPGNDGGITLGVQGGTYPYDYEWSGGFAADSILTGLQAGSYAVTVSDQQGCTGTATAIVLVQAPPLVTGLPDGNIDCAGGSDGTLTVTALPGDAPIIGYAWSNGQQGTTLSALAPGTYVVTITDQNGCTTVDTALVTSPPPIQLDSVAFQSPQCPGLGGGALIAFPLGGTPPYLFQWSNGVAGTNFNVISNLTAGSYGLTLTDANNCPPFDTVLTLADPPAILAAFSGIDSVSCANVGTGCDGQATATAGYADGSSGFFNFTWQSGETTASATTSTASALCAGPQTLTISDGTCFVDTTVLIPSPLPIVPGQQITNVSCFEGVDGEITLLPSGGTPPYQIVWAGGTAGNTLTDLTAGSYGALITDANGCAFTHTVLVAEPEPFVVSLNPLETADIRCPGGDDGVISLVLQGGNIATGAPVFLWEDGVAPTNSPVADGLLPGLYSVTVVDVKGCEASLTHLLSEPPPIRFVLEDIEPILCFGETTFLTVASVSGGSPGPYVFSVDNGIDKLPGEYSPVLAGTHVVTVTDALLGCRADTTVVVDQPLELSVELPAVVEIELGDTLTVLDPSIFSSLPIESFSWEPADQLSCTDCKNPRVNAIRSQRYTLTVVDTNGCVAVTQVLVDIDRNRNIFIPNVFSPNGDGINDRFQVFAGRGVERIDFVRVYDRWGDLLFEALDLAPSVDGTSPGWDGTFRGETMDPADFLYLIQVRYVDGQVLLYRGDVVLAR